MRTPSLAVSGGQPFLHAQVRIALLALFLAFILRDQHLRPLLVPEKFYKGESQEKHFPCGRIFSCFPARDLWITSKRGKARDGQRPYRLH
jgi:hypothetical protein